jgi:hypothetical protein
MIDDFIVADTIIIRNNPQNFELNLFFSSNETAINATCIPEEPTFSTKGGPV